MSGKSQQINQDTVYLLLPPSLQDWLPENTAYFVVDLVDQLDLAVSVNWLEFP